MDDVDFIISHCFKGILSYNITDQMQSNSPPLWALIASVKNNDSIIFGFTTIMSYICAKVSSQSNPLPPSTAVTTTCVTICLKHTFKTAKNHLPKCGSLCFIQIFVILCLDHTDGEYEHEKCWWNWWNHSVTRTFAFVGLAPLCVPVKNYLTWHDYWTSV